MIFDRQDLDEDQLCRSNDERSTTGVAGGASFDSRALLLIAACLKTHQLATEPLLGNGLLHSRWFLIGVIELELFFAFWLFAGLFPVLTWLASLGLFSIFSLVSLFKAVLGEASCGCFGTVEVNPWLTFVLDGSIVGGLLYWRPKASGDGFKTGNTPTYFAQNRFAILVGAWLSLSIGSGALLASYESTRLGEVGHLLGDGRIVVLEPETWIGKRFPLLDWIEVGPPLAQGRWVVMLHRRGCPDCDVLLHRFAEDSDDALLHSDVQVAFVDVEPARGDAVSALPHRASFHHGQLAGTYEWFVQTPVQFALQNGVVQEISTDGAESLTLADQWHVNRDGDRVLEYSTQPEKQKTDPCGKQKQSAERLMSSRGDTDQRP